LEGLSPQSANRRAASEQAHCLRSERPDAQHGDARSEAALHTRNPLPTAARPRPSRALSARDLQACRGQRDLQVPAEVGPAVRAAGLAGAGAHFRPWRRGVPPAPKPSGTAQDHRAGGFHLPPPVPLRATELPSPRLLGPPSSLPPLPGPPSDTLSRRTSIDRQSSGGFSFLDEGRSVSDVQYQRGILFLLLVSAEDVPKMDAVSSCSPVIRLHVAGVKRESSMKIGTQAPIWNERFDFFNIKVTGSILVKLYDATYMGKWKVGSVLIPVARVASAPDGILRDSFRIAGAYASPFTRVTLSMEWVPLDGNPVPALVLSDSSGDEARFDSSRSREPSGALLLLPTKSLLRQEHQRALANAFAGVDAAAGASPTAPGGRELSASPSPQRPFSFSTWIETPSQLAPAGRRPEAERAAHTRLSVRVMGCTMQRPRPSTFCELRVSRTKPRCTSVQHLTSQPFWDEQFCWQGVSETDILTIQLKQQGMMWSEKVGEMRIPLSEVRGAPGCALVGSWRLSECRDDEPEVAMELVWWEASGRSRSTTPEEEHGRGSGATGGRPGATSLAVPVPAGSLPASSSCSLRQDVEELRRSSYAIIQESRQSITPPRRSALLGNSLASPPGSGSRTGLK